MAIWLESQDMSVSTPNGMIGPTADDALQTPPGHPIQEQVSNWIDVHLNFWLLPDAITIDIGIMFPCSNHETIKIYINNSDIKTNNVEEITKKYLEQEDIRDLIFNDKLSIKNQCNINGSGHCLSAQKSDSDELFCLNFDEHKLEVNENKFGGFIINLKISNRNCVENIDKVYSRLRISGDVLKNIFPFMKDPTSYLQYHTIEYKFIDLRVNDLRTLPHGLLADKRILPVIRHMRCFIMLNATLQMICTSNRYEKVRSLEKELWVKYITINNKNKGPILAYQWNTDSTNDKSIKNFSLFLKIRKNYVKKLTAIGTLVIIVILGIIASCMADYIVNKLDICLKKEFVIPNCNCSVEQVVDSDNDIDKSIDPKK